MAKQSDDKSTIDLLSDVQSIIELKSGYVPLQYFIDLIELTKIETSLVAALELHLVDGFTQVEAARRFNINQGNISRAVNMLRRKNKVVASLSAYLR